MRYHPFKVYNSVVLSIFTRLFNYHVKFQNIFITPERNPVPINSCSPFSTPFSPLQPLVCSSSEYLSILGILYKWLFVSVFFHLAGEGNGTPLQYSCLENPMGGGAWWAAVHGVAKRHNWATSLSLFTFMHWRRKWQPTPVFLPGESRGRGSLVGCRLWDSTESDTTEAT